MKKMKPNTAKILGENGSYFYIDTRTGVIRKRWWTKARIPGTVRPSRMPVGSGYKGDEAWITNDNSLQALVDAYD